MSDYSYLDDVIELRVAIPQARVDNRGVDSTRHESAERKTIRFTGEEIKVITKWHEIMNMSWSSFVRDAAYNTALALEKMERENANRSDRGD